LRPRRFTALISGGSASDSLSGGASAFALSTTDRGLG
jgi:hypothetical protein